MEAATILHLVVSVNINLPTVLLRVKRVWRAITPLKKAHYYVPCVPLDIHVGTLLLRTLLFVTPDHSVLEGKQSAQTATRERFPVIRVLLGVVTVQLAATARREQQVRRFIVYFDFV